MDEQSRFAEIHRTLSIPNFRNYMAGNFVSQFGLWTQRIGVQVLTWELTHSPFWLGVMAFADLFPLVVLGPVGGVMADRLNPLWSLRSYIALSGILSAFIAGITFAGHMNEFILLILVFANGCVLAFNYPLRVSIVPSLVNPESLTSAISINSVCFSIARLGGPALAGLMLARWESEGVQLAISFTVFADIVFIVALCWVSLVRPLKVKENKPLREVPGELVEGFRYIRNHPGLVPLIVILVMTSLFGRPFTDLFAGFSDQVFDMGRVGISWFTSTQGIGAIVGSVVLATYSGVVGLTKKMVFTILIMSVAVLGFAATSVFWFALICTLLGGYALVVIGVIELSLMQASVDESMRGRVSSVYIICSRGCPAFGALLMGTIAEFAGFQLPIAGGAVVCLMVWIWARSRQAGLAQALEKVAETR
jgi:MFS family permease